MEQATMTKNEGQTTETPELSKNKKIPVIPKQFIMPFILVTSLFALWGFANDITNPMVAAFQSILQLSTKQSSLVQVFFYGGYAIMAIPAALFIRKYSYKAGILVGLTLYALGALLFIPAGIFQKYEAFLISYLIITFGLSFLETTANPYILSMGHEKTATQRLNFAQSFNPMGSFIGMLIASKVILAKLQVSAIRNSIVSENPKMKPDIIGSKVNETLQAMDTSTFKALQEHDMKTIMWPYVILGCVVFAVLLLFIFSKLPKTAKHDNQLSLNKTFKLIWKPEYYLGVVAQTFYVGAQIMCWTYIIQYAMTTVGLSMEHAQYCNMGAMGLFIISRFICTFLLKYVSPGNLLKILASVAMALTAVVIFVPGVIGLAALIAISGCMSLMFPTIYGIALDGMGEEAKLASAGLIFAIVGGSVLTFIQAAFMDLKPLMIGSYKIPPQAYSFVVVFLCFAIIATYGFLTHKFFRPPSEKIEK